MSEISFMAPRWGRSMPLLLWGALVLSGGCEKVKKDGSSSEPASGVAGASAQGVPVTTAAPPSASAQGKQPSPHGIPGGLSGVVLETIEAGKYTYARLETAQGMQWTAVPKAQLAVGQRISVANPMLMRDFESKTLKRKFAAIYFGVLGPAKPAAAPSKREPSDGDVAMAHRGVLKGDDAAKLSKPLAKAEGAQGRSVAEIYQQKAKLADQPVIVRGKVVKVNNGIMGRNWAHLQDGSRSTAGDYDLTITTQERLEVGQVVVVKGKLAMDRDFGAGYRYPVILEGAKVEPK